jgi:predicted metal-dependent phosphoesterase TrpH
MIDLHMHSFYSEDGEYSPRELVNQCAEKGIRLMSVSDHNTVSANAEAVQAAHEKGIRCITGTEVDCMYAEQNFHVLGYGIDERGHDFTEIEQAVREQSRAASLERLKKTGELGFSLTAEMLEAGLSGSHWPESWPGELFAEVLLADPRYRDHPLLRPYRTGGSRSDNPYVNFYWDFYAPGKPCFAKINYPSARQTLDIIHRNHGFAVLAHPGMNLKGRADLLDGLIALGLDGIEACSSYHTPQQALYYTQQAREHGLFITCGSDYHGKTKPAVKLGGHGSPLPDDELIRQLPGTFFPE